MGVKYQTYLDEGFDKDVIKGLFRDLHLDMPKSPTQAPKDLPPPVKPTQDKVPLAGPAASSKEQNASGPSEASKADRAGEERKDRIARLLAAKAAKAPVASVPQPAPAAPSQPQNPTPPTMPAKTKVWGEKELLLKQKMAALQKSREAQTQKPAPAPATNTGASPASQVNNQQKTAPPKPDLSRSEKQNSGPQTGAIPGLLLSGSQPGQTAGASQRKRPVAADFVEYSSTVGPLKRPFGQDRKETSLIIDISDASDDEEVDMDMGSPVDDPATLGAGPFAQSGPAIRDFPPLTDGLPNRQFSSPAQLSQTTPGGSILTRRRETELDLKEREIQEMRRKIAEAEAKRKAKQPSVGAQTPKKGNGANQRGFEAARPPLGRRAPSSSDGPSAQLMLEASSAKLPKLSERVVSGQSPRAEFKTRIASQDLPRIKGSIEEKRMRLKQLQEEQERLKAELDQQFAEEKLLTEQLEEMEAQPSDGESQPNGTSPNDDSGKLSEILWSCPVTDKHRAGHVSASEGQAEPSAAASAQATTSGSPDEESDDDISMDEDPSSRENSVERDDVMPDAPGAETAGGTTDVASTVPLSAAADQPPSSATHPQEQPATTSPEFVPTDHSEPEPTTSVDHGPESGTAPAESSTAHVDETSAMEMESGSQSPAPAESTSGQSPTDEESRDQSRRRSSSPLQISDVAEPREINQEIEQGVVREVHVVSPSPSAQVLTW